LGGLARWWLRPEVLYAAAQCPGIPMSQRQEWLTTPALPATCGSCWIILVQLQQRQTPLLRHAFLLPFRWIPNSPHSNNLPTELRALADEVRRQACSFSDEGYRALKPHWGLHLSDVDGIDRIDLSRIRFTWSSGFVSLLGGLILANNDGRPDPKTWATGAFQGGAICRVDGVEAKVRLAAEWGASALYLPSDGIAEVASRHGLRLGKLDSSATNPIQAMAEYLQDLQVPPGRQEARESRAAYYLRIQNRQRAEEYFRSACLDDISADCHGQLLKLLPDRDYASLVTILDGSSSVALLAVRSVQPKRCLALYTVESDAQRTSFSEQWRSLGHRTDPHFGLIDQNNLPETIRRHVHDFRRNSKGKLVFDLTPGTKLMSLTLAAAADRPGDTLIYIGHQQATSKRAIPFTQQIIVVSPGPGARRTASRTSMLARREAD
jgi:hypothetical protein